MDHRAFPSSVQAAGGLCLRLARDDDAETIAAWTQAPDVHRWWGGRAIEVDEARSRYTGRRVPAVVSYVVCEHARPIGYAQAWQRTGRFGLDMFIAADAQGRGLGPRAARALAERLTQEGWAPLTVDPAVDNSRAIKAWHAAGFRKSGHPVDEGGVLMQVMTYDP